MRKQKDAFIAVRVPKTLKELIREIISIDTHLNEADFVRDAIREKYGETRLSSTSNFSSRRLGDMRDNQRSVFTGKLNEGSFQLSRQCLPKLVRHIIREEVKLDSVAFLYRNGKEQPRYIISDREGRFVKGEKPMATFSLIKEGRRDFQIRVGIRGRFHIERLRYYVKDPKYWLEWGWMIIPISQISKLRHFLKSIILPTTGLWELI